MDNKKIIAIDPDVDKNGVAVYWKEGNVMQVLSFSFFELMNYMKTNVFSKGFKPIIIEAGYLNQKSNFHGTRSARNAQSYGEKVSEATGRNGQVSRLLSEMCDYLGFEHKEVLPLKKTWRGRDGKITHDELIKLLHPLKITLVDKDHQAVKKTNQEQRDAVLLALYRS